MSTPPIPPAPKNPGLAITSLVCGIVGFLTGPLTGIPAIITGHLALGKINKSAGSLGGSGKAITGLILGYITTVLISFLAALATPAIHKALERANMAENISHVRQISIALQEYALHHDDAFPATLAELKSEGLILPLPDLAYKANDKTTHNWIYHPGFNSNSPLNFIIIAAPETIENKSVPSRIIGRIDGSANVIPESDYQSQIRAQSP